MFKSVFGANQSVGLANTTHFRLINDFQADIQNFEGELYDIDTVRSCIHAIASNASKLKPKHISSSQEKQTYLEKMLQSRPNEYMNTYDFIYRVVSQLYSTNNAFIYIKSEFGKVVGLYPLNYSSCQLREYQNEMYLTFLFKNGNQVTIPYSEIIHLRRHYNRHEMFGEDGTKALYPTVNMMNTLNQGIVNAVKASARLRGILKFSQSLRPEDLKRQKDEFVNDYLGISNNGGIGALDSKADFQELQTNIKMADDRQLALVRGNVYRYFNVSENIITSNYDENEYNAFYSSVIEPIAIQLSLEFTNKLFTEREKGHGNQIVFSAERLTFATNRTKASIINTLLPLGILSINEARTILELSPIEDGDRHLVSLNYVDLSKANKYQLGEEENDEPKNNDDNETDESDGEPT